MSDYISREAFKKKYLCCGYLPEMSEKEFDDFPAADVEPVRHGKWVEAGRGIDACSECNHGIREHMACVNKYCPNCGAKMDLGGNSSDS